ncbi:MULTISPECIES: protein-methionine-sulfoxide reductase heme-binding subunit MsrQ [Giesbergeria]|uniref:Protein-methionine-sulfoxide reductase heme-binding subunit MsrQ n=1 Tax=Giesbergeria sinuosa TaxID=80883 RepID=A0ABV9Q8F6_9BURK
MVLSRPSRSWLLHPLVKPLLWGLLLAPLCWLVYGTTTNTLGANPAEALIRALGDWTLRLLCLALAITPLRVLTRTPALARFRRLVGLFVFFYAVLHALAYAVFDMGLEAADIADDVRTRPFILVGVLAWVLLALLAATSFQQAIRWLGAGRWQMLHRAVYAVAGLSILHFFWMRSGKNNFAEVILYGSVLLILLGWRGWHYWQQRRRL